MNHNYLTGGFSTVYLSRNRVRSWDEQSFTIQAGARHAPPHPQAPQIVNVERNRRIFAPGREDAYRRLTVREAARIQTFPDGSVFVSNKITDAHKIVGNAVPVNLAHALAEVVVKYPTNAGIPTKQPRPSTSRSPRISRRTRRGGRGRT